MEGAGAGVRVGLIGGSSLLHSSVCAGLEQVCVSTARGPVVLYRGPGYVFVQRHKYGGGCALERGAD